MANPVERLLNVVDDHKRDMPDNAYKGIMDELASIKKVVETKHRSKYKVFFIECSIKRQEHDESMAEVDRTHHRVEVYLTEDEAKHINKELDQYGVICQLEYKLVEEQQGLHHLEMFRQVFSKRWEDVIVEVDVNYKSDDNEYKEGKLIYDNEVLITRVVKM